MNSSPRQVGLALGGIKHGRLEWARGNDSVREVIRNILLTNPGERLMRPEFGAGLRRFVHHPNNESTRNLLVDAARRGIERWEPRVALLAVTATPDPYHPNQVTLGIRYRLRFDGQEAELQLGLDLNPS